MLLQILTTKTNEQIFNISTKIGTIYQHVTCEQWQHITNQPISIIRRPFIRQLGSAGAGVRFRTIKEPLSAPLANGDSFRGLALGINVLLCQYDTYAGDVRKDNKALVNQVPSMYFPSQLLKEDDI